MLQDKPIGRSIRIAILALLLAAPALGQTLTGVVAAKNGGNSADEFYADLAISYERESALAVTGATATTISTRYVALVSADAGVSAARAWKCSTPTTPSPSRSTRRAPIG